MTASALASVFIWLLVTDHCCYFSYQSRGLRMFGLYGYTRVPGTPFGYGLNWPVPPTPAQFFPPHPPRIRPHEPHMLSFFQNISFWKNGFSPNFGSQSLHPPPTCGNTGIRPIGAA